MSFGNTEQQIKQPASNFNFCHPQQQSKSFNFRTTAGPTGTVFGAATTAPSAFSFCDKRPFQANQGVLSNMKTSFGTINTSGPLLSFFGTKVPTGGLNASSPTTSVFNFRTETASANTKKAEFSFRNETVANAEFGLRPLHCKEPLSFHQTTANTTSSFVFGTTPTITNPLGSILKNSAPAAVTSSEFIFGNGKGTTNFGDAPTTAPVTHSSVFTRSASSNVATGFSLETQQPSQFQIGTPTSLVVSSTVCSGLTPEVFMTTTESSQTSSSTQPGIGDNICAPTRTVVKIVEATENQSIIKMSDHGNKSFEEIRLEDYYSNRNIVNSGLAFGNEAPNFSFSNRTHSPHGSETSNPFLSMGATQHKQIPTVFGTSSTSIVPYGFGRTFNTQHTDIALAPSNYAGAMNQAENSLNIPKLIFEDAQRKSVNGSNFSRTLSSILFEHLELAAVNNVKKFALDTLLALMITSKTNSVPDILNMIPRNVGLDDFKTQLICAAEELNCELLSKNVDELIKQLAKVSSKVIHIKLPTGETLIRSFMADTPLSLLLTYLASEGYPDLDYKVLTTWPSRDLTVLNRLQTLEDLKFYPKDYLSVEKR